jgi:hypothetical protein
MADLSFDDLIPQRQSPDAAAAASPGADFSDLLPNYRGSILPFSTDAQGNNHLDWSAGLPGALWSAFTAPGDAATGRLPTPYSGYTPGRDSANASSATASLDAPEARQRASDFAQFFGSSGAALRAGEAIPGVFTKKTIPTAQQLKAAAGAGYDAARASGLEVSGDAVGDMARGLQSTLQSDQGIIEKTAPKTYALLDELANPPANSSVGIPGLLAAKSGLSNLSLEPGTEGLAARHALAGLRVFMSSLDDSQLAPSNLRAAPAQDSAAVAQTIRDADANYAAAQRSNDLTGTLDRANTGILERAEARAEASHSGRNLDNAIRQRVASFLQNPENLAGFSQPEIDALKSVVAGGPVQNTARFVGNTLGGGGGLGHLIGIGAGALGGAHLGGGEGAAIGAMLPSAVGTAAKTLENNLARRSLNSADETVRQNSPLYRAMQAQGLLARPAIGGSSAVWRAILPGLLAPATPTPTPPKPIPQGLLANWA